jgi:6-phospho-3-hexuloisomerase
MTDSSTFAFAQSNVDELRALMSTVPADAADELVQRILDARKVYFSGAGRSGLMAKAVAMRLMHIGLQSFAVGEIATPGISAGDLLVVFSARGGQATIAQARTARSVGADVAAITVRPDADLVGLAVTVLTLPVRTEVPTQQHAGSLFEQGCLVLGDAICRAVQEKLGVPTAELDKRHANLS